MNLLENAMRFKRDGRKIYGKLRTHEQKTNLMTQPLKYDAEL